jgi:hypothetical protein
LEQRAADSGSEGGSVLTQASHAVQTVSVDQLAQYLADVRQARSPDSAPRPMHPLTLCRGGHRRLISDLKAEQIQHLLMIRSSERCGRRRRRRPPPSSLTLAALHVCAGTSTALRRR